MRAGFESATKSLLFQIASGVSVRHINPDLKSQNIFLELVMNSEELEMEMEETAHSAYSNTFVLGVWRQAPEVRAMQLVPGAIKQVVRIKQDDEHRWPLP